MSDILAALVSFFLLGPIETELARQLDGVNAPRAAITGALDCARASAPAIADRVLSNPVWAAWQVYDVWIGGKRPEAILVEIAPSCAGPVNILKPYLNGALRA